MGDSCCTRRQAWPWVPLWEEQRVLGGRLQEDTPSATCPDLGTVGARPEVGRKAVPTPSRRAGALARETGPGPGGVGPDSGSRILRRGTDTPSARGPHQWFPRPILRPCWVKWVGQPEPLPRGPGRAPESGHVCLHGLATENQHTGGAHQRLPARGWLPGRRCPLLRETGHREPQAACWRPADAGLGGPSASTSRGSPPPGAGGRGRSGPGA